MEQALAIRLDKWLWAARFFKTRSLASKAISGGKIQVNGFRAKASKQVHLNDRLLIQTGFDEREVEVLALSEQRGPASEASKLYQETEASLQKREQQKELRRLNALAMPIHNYRPTKKDRRLLAQLKGKY